MANLPPITSQALTQHPHFQGKFNKQLDAQFPEDKKRYEALYDTFGDRAWNAIARTERLRQAGYEYSHRILGLIFGVLHPFTIGEQNRIGAQLIRKKDRARLTLLRNTAKEKAVTNSRFRPDGQVKPIPKNSKLPKLKQALTEVKTMVLPTMSTSRYQAKLRQLEATLDRNIQHVEKQMNLRAVEPGQPLLRSIAQNLHDIQTLQLQMTRKDRKKRYRLEYNA